MLLALFEHLSIPLPISDLRVPDVYKTIARDPGDFTVLEIPLAWRNGFRMTGTLDQAMMFEQWYQTEHRHPILGGNTSRNPELKFQYFTEAPVINSIIAAETGHGLDPETLARDKALAPDVLRFFGIRYVVWHSPRDPQNRFALDAARAYVENILPVTKFYEVSDENGDISAYRVNDLPPLNQTMLRPDNALGTCENPASCETALARLNFAEGWSALGEFLVWAARYEAKLYWRLDQPRDSTISFYIAPLNNQHVTLTINGREAARVLLNQGAGVYQVRVAKDMWRVGMNQIVFKFDALTPASVEGRMGFAASIVASSAGSEVGDFAHIFVNGVDESPNERGYNFVVVDVHSGLVEARAAFDTFASEENSARLARFIEQIPEGKIVALAVRDEASRNLTEEAVNALHSIGAREDLRGRFRWSHAMIGRKGIGRGVERASEIAPAQVVEGIGAMEPNVAAAFEWIMVK